MSERDETVTSALTLAICRELCAWVQRRESVEVWHWLSEMRTILGRLRERLPLGAVQEATVLPLVPDDVKFDLFQRLHGWLGDVATYWLEGDSQGGNDSRAVLTGNLADDVADIYCEVEPVLGLLEQGQIGEQAALCMLRTGFHHHWGQHVRDAERYLWALTAARPN